MSQLHQGAYLGSERYRHFVFPQVGKKKGVGENVRGMSKLDFMNEERQISLIFKSISRKCDGNLNNTYHTTKHGNVWRFHTWGAFAVSEGSRFHSIVGYANRKQLVAPKSGTLYTRMHGPEFIVRMRSRIRV